MNKQVIKIALAGNPNSGKTSVFNLLTGLNQRTGNFPGITVDKKIGKLNLTENKKADLIDLPGTYSLYPLSFDERIVVKSLLQKDDENFPELIIYVADSTHLEKNLLLFTQIKDLGFPILLALNMSDLAEKKGINIDTEKLSKELKAPVIKISGRTGEGLDDLKKQLVELHKSKIENNILFYSLAEKELTVSKKIREIFPEYSDYQSLIIANHSKWFPLEKQKMLEVKNILTENDFDDIDAQVQETLKRYDIIEPIIGKTVSTKKSESKASNKIDKILTNNVFGILIFFVLMAFVFQAVFEYAGVPMDIIDGAFGSLAEFARENLPEVWFTNLLVDGIIAGIGGVLIFIPQIAILFLFITLMQEIGYLARVAYMLDKVMRKFGLNGRSAIALISGGACSIPAIMSARTISNPKERLITILVTPFISCAARIPVYAILVAFVVPDKTVLGFMNLQGLVFMSMYLLGIVGALGASFVIHKFMKNSEPSYLLLELPDYKIPLIRNVLFNVWEKVRLFVVEAGKVILVIAILLWFLAAYGPSNKMEVAEQAAIEYAETNNLSELEAEDLIASNTLEASYIGHLGKFIEPAIEPLGYDWKMGIGLIASFAAREAFVGTMATIYSIGSSEEETTIQERMRREINPKTGKPMFTMAVSLSLLIFYVFAMQCMATLAVVYRETKTWKYPIYQFVFMTAVAYIASFIVFQIFK